MSIVSETPVGGTTAVAVKKREDDDVVVSNENQELITAATAAAAAAHDAVPSGGGLRFDWTNLPVQSPIAKTLQAHQNHCSLPVKHYLWRDFDGIGCGMGSDLHAWGSALWAGLNDGHRIRSPSPWLWIDQRHCGTSCLFECYFTQSEPACPDEVIDKREIRTGPCFRGVKGSTHNYTIPDFRAAATEFAFSSISPAVVNEAQEQRHLLFGDLPTPKNLITVHVRWGDKVMEGRRENNPMQHYVQAIETLVDENDLEDVHILLCTEDPVALDAFRNATNGKGWTILVDASYHKYLPYRQDREIVYNLPSFVANETKGESGLWALGSLLVAMEANYFVLATKSNWSRLMNELRKNVVDPSCNGCTKMIDIEKGEC
jgi:hypothetical protein